MNDETINLLIVIGALVAFIVFSQIRRSRRQLVESARTIETLQAQPAAPVGTKRDERVDQLEQRLRVVERIVTDNGFDVATQIEALRHQPERAKVIEDRSVRQ